jgi:hypothetical protein
LTERVVADIDSRFATLGRGWESVHDRKRALTPAHVAGRLRAAERALPEPRSSLTIW